MIPGLALAFGLENLTCSTQELPLTDLYQFPRATGLELHGVLDPDNRADFFSVKSIAMVPFPRRWDRESLQSHPYPAIQLKDLGLNTVEFWSWNSVRNQKFS